MALTKLTIRGQFSFDVLTDCKNHTVWDVVNMLHEDEGERFWDVLVPNLISDHIVTPKPADVLEIGEAVAYEGDPEADGLMIVNWEDWVDPEFLRQQELSAKLDDLKDELDVAIASEDYQRVSEIAEQLAKITNEERQ